MGRNGWNLDKEQRIQLKLLISGLGLLLLIILLLGQALAGLFRQNEDEIHIPLMETLTNVWIVEADESGILIFREGVEERYSYGYISESDKEHAQNKVLYAPIGNVREQIADIVLSDGSVTEINPKTEKINGTVLSVDDSFVEVEGYGKIPLASDYKGYRIYKALEMCTEKDLHIGYKTADFVMEMGEICGILIVKEEAMEYIRVLIKGSDYAGLLHDSVVLSADSNFTIQYGTHDNPMQEQHAAGEEMIISTDSPYFIGERIVITPKVLTGKLILKNVNRSQGMPSYRGHIELLKTEDGIAVINQVLLEEYLYCVVPSEMPSSYPEEALKAQAICARTYAYEHMLNAGYPGYGAHADDSTSYQVYNNILEQESTTTAVKETYGQLLFTKEGDLAGTYYYSTSCGVGSDANVWKTKEAAGITYLVPRYINAKATEALVGQEKTTTETVAGAEQLQNEEEFTKFITSKNADDFEVTEGWYRWSYQVNKLDAERICGLLQKRYDANSKLVLTYDGAEFVEKPIKEFHEIHDIYIAKRGVGGVADELHIVTEENTYKIITEYNIRYVLNNGESMVVRQDGSKVEAPNILPSAFFAITLGKEKENVVGYTLTGGGFGHGVGMSQNGARHMAERGYTAQDILLFFYDDCSLRNIYENTK